AQHRGGIKEVLTIALPMVISYACESVMIFTDRLFLSQLGPDLMNASMAGGVTAYMMMTFFLGLCGYCTALVAQYFGAGQKGKSSVAVTQAVIIALIGYPLILASRPAAYILFDKSGIGPGQLQPQLLYFNTLLWFCLFPLLRQTLSSYFTGIGKTRVVMGAAITAMGVNVVANYLLIFGKCGFPQLGILGAACGTVIGALTGLVVLLSVYVARTNADEFGVRHSLRFDQSIMGRLLRFGYPPGLEMFLNLIAFDLFILIFHAVGPASATSSTIALNWDIVIYVPLIGLEMGITSLVGRYMGARDIAAAKNSVRSALGMGLIYALTVIVVFTFFADHLVDVFRAPGAQPLFDEARPLAKFMLRCIMFYVGIQALYVVLIGALRGAGDTLWAMGFSVILHWVMVPILYVMLHIWHTPVEWAWVSVIVVFYLSATILVARYRAGKWQAIEMVPEDQLPPPRLHDEMP
ncbi:MAG: MATE family efflux transporter, partial [Candidatus Omnitrophica bacterium]|nr:MATE family efflux transporter [Candidatus Omnitrophota bacterium]